MGVAPPAVTTCVLVFFTETMASMDVSPVDVVGSDGKWNKTRPGHSPINNVACGK